MFDGIKILRSSTPASVFEENSLLDFKVIVSERSGEVSSRKFAKNKGLSIQIVEGKSSIRRVEINGSLHRWKNNGVHNYDDYNYSDVLRTLEALERTLLINPDREILNGLEIGVNLELTFSVEEILGILITYKGNRFQEWREKGMSYFQCETDEIIIKIYDKGSEFKLKNNILRVEIKIREMRFLKRNGAYISQLSDLANQSNYPVLGQTLLSVFSNIMFDNPNLNLGTFSIKDQLLIHKGRNPKYWQRPDKSQFRSITEYKCSSKRLNRDETRFKTLVKSDRAIEVANKIREKWEELSGCKIAEDRRMTNQKTQYVSNSATISNFNVA